MMNSVEFEKLKAEMNLENLQKFSANIPQRIPWLKRYKNGLSGVLCVVISLFLIITILLHSSYFLSSFNNLMKMAIVAIIALYCLVKGVFTIIFQFKENEYYLSVNQYFIIGLYNKLYFVYEKLCWLYFLGPILLLFCVFVRISSFILILLFLFYFVVLLLFSPRLVKHRNQIKNEISLKKNK